MALPPVFIEFLGSYTGLKATADGVKEELASVDAEGGASMEKLGGVSKAALLGVGLALAGAGYESLKLAVSFQSAMLQISTQAGVPQSQLKALGNGVLALAGQVGFSPDSLAEALYHIESSFASVGITGSQALNILKIAAEGAAVGHANLVDVQNALDAAIASGIPGVQNYTQAMGALNAIVGSGDMQMQDLADALGTGVLAVVKGYGLTLNDVGASLATFGDNNIRGASAATDLRMAVQAMAVPAATAGDLLKKLGMNTTTLSKDMQTGGLQKAVNDLNDRLKAAGITGDQVGAAMVTLFGKKAGSGLDVLVGQIDRLNSKYPELEKGANSFGAAVAANNQTIQQKMNDAKAAFDALGVKIGTALLPTVTKVLGAVAALVGFLTIHTSAFYAIAAGIGALGIAFLAASIASWSFTDSILADPVFWIALAIAALIAGLVELIMHWKTVAAWLDSAWHATVSGLVDAWHWVTAETSAAWRDITGAVMVGWHTLVGWFDTAVHLWVEPWIVMWDTTRDIAVAGWHAVVRFFVGAYHMVVDPILAAWHMVADVTATVWDAIAGFFKKWWPLLLVIFELPIAVMISTWNHFHTEAFAIARSVWNGIVAFFRATWMGLVDIAGMYFEWIRLSIVYPLQDAWRAIVATWTLALKWLASIWGDIEDAAKVAWQGVYTYVVAPIDAAWHWLQGLWNGAVKWLDRAWHGIEATAGSIWLSVKNAIISPIDSAYHWLTSAVGNIGSTLMVGFNGLLTWLGGLWDSWVNIGKNIVLGIVHGLEGAGSGLLTSVKGLANDALTAAKNFLGIHSPSTLFAREVGQWITHGIAQGVTGASSVATSAVRRVASGMANSLGGMRAPSLGTSGGSGGTTVQNIVQMEVKGSVRSDHDLRDLIQQEMLRLGGRNSATWAPAKI